MHFLRLFLRLFRNYVYYHFIFPKINNGGVRIKAGGGLENFSNINKQGRQLFGTQEYNSKAVKRALA